LFKIGRAEDLETRLKTHRKDYGPFKLKFSIYVWNMQSIERLVKGILREKRYHVTEWYDVSDRTARRAVDLAIERDVELRKIFEGLSQGQSRIALPAARRAA